MNIVRESIGSCKSIKDHESIEDIVLRHSSRGMPALRDCLPEHWCRTAAEAILGWARGTVLLITGFYVAGFAETDGPLGTTVLARAVEDRLSLTPSEIGADILVIATVSNWGAYGITAALSELTGQDLLMSFTEAENFLRRTVALGSVEGISHEHKLYVDGFGPETEQEIFDALHEYIAARIPTKTASL